MVITPNTDLYLVQVPLEIDDNNQLTFANANAQFTYFSSLPRINGDGRFTYQRKDGVVRFDALIDDILEYNYVMYRNTSYSDKWFYAYITKMEYVNDRMTAITIKTDVWQTWQFDLTYKPVLIDREHQNTDVAGDNLLPESLELGEYVTNGNVENFGDASSFCIIAEVAQVENTGESATLSYRWADDSESRPVNPILNDSGRGTVPLVLDTFTPPQVPTSRTIQNLVSIYDLAGLGDAIINVYMLPSTLIGTTHEIWLTATSGQTTKSSVFAVPDAKLGVYEMTTKTITRPTTVDGFTPKNKKVLTAPYCYFNISNNGGSSNPYHYEDFGSTIEFKIEGTFGVSGSVKAIPLDYKNISASENALDYSVSGAKFPVCSWKSDSYTNWLTQNAVNMQSQWTSAIAGSTLTTLGSGFTSGGAGLVAGVFQSGANLISLAREQHLAKTRANMTPDQVRGNLNAGDFTWAKYRTPFTYLPMSIKYNQARIIDEYFSQFGYKCDRVKIPNITGRRNWNFVKTIGCYIEANIPQDDLKEIKSMFDKGVTFWHNPATFADYSQNNDIV